MLGFLTLLKNPFMIALSDINKRNVENFIPISH